VVTQIAAASRALDRAGFKVVASGLVQCAAAEDRGETPDLSRPELEKLFLSLA
jgi:DNA-binding FrmR family transcriptional regulator